MTIATYLKAFALGFLTGGRSMAGPALLSDRLMEEEPSSIQRSPLRLFSEPWLAALLKMAAAGEMAADKLPFVPARTNPAPLMGRIVLGAFSGLLLCAAEKRSLLLGALAGGAGALAGTFGFYHARRLLGEQTHIDDPLLGLAEDALIVGSGVALVAPE